MAGGRKCRMSHQVVAVPSIHQQSTYLGEGGKGTERPPLTRKVTSSQAKKKVNPPFPSKKSRRSSIPLSETLVSAQVSPFTYPTRPLATPTAARDSS